MYSRLAAADHPLRVAVRGHRPRPHGFREAVRNCGGGGRRQFGPACRAASDRRRS